MWAQQYSDHQDGDAGRRTPDFMNLPQDNMRPDRERLIPYPCWDLCCWASLQNAAEPKASPKWWQHRSNSDITGM